MRRHGCLRIVKIPRESKAAVGFVTIMIFIGFVSDVVAIFVDQPAAFCDVELTHLLQMQPIPIPIITLKDLGILNQWSWIYLIV